MPAVIVDANVLIAARLSRDQNHDRGEAITQAIDEGTLPTAYVLSDVLEEVINYLQARAGHDVATETLDAVIESSGFSLRRTTKSDFDTGRSLFRRYEPLSLTDAVIVAMMQREDVEYLYRALVNHWTASASTVRTSGMKRETTDGLCRRSPASRRKQFS